MDADRFRFNGSDVLYAAPSVKHFFRDGTHSLHSAIAFRDLNNDLRLVHLGWEKELHHNPYQPGYYCSLLPPTISQNEQKWLANYCTLVAEAPENKDAIPYGIRTDAESGFDANGVWSPADEDSAMSCATFVLKVFHAAGYPLAETANWPVRGEDTGTQRRLVGMLKDDPETRHRGLQQEPHIGKCPRVRPEEVAGSPLEDSIPACVAQCLANGQWVLRQIEQAKRLQPNCLDPR